MHKTSEWLQSFKSAPLQPNFLKNSTKKTVKLSITGGKGGVGKTSIALKTGLDLAKAGFKTLVIDCDSNLSNTAIKLGTPITNNFERLIKAQVTFEECLVQNGRFHLLPTCNGSLELFESRLNFDEIIIDIIQAHEDEYDYIILDCPAGISRESLNLNAYCDFRWMIVTPDKASITDSYSLIKVLFHKYHVQENHLLINMFQNETQRNKVAQTLSDTVRNFLGMPLHQLGGIPRLDVSAETFDTFFLSEAKSDLNKNFAKILYKFTEQVGGLIENETSAHGRSVTIEQDVH